MAFGHAASAVSRIATTDSRQGLPIGPNLLDRNFHVATPNSVWVGDITFIPTDEGWLFLAVVIDLFSRQSWAGHCARICAASW